MSIDAMKMALEALETVRHQNMSPQIHPAKVALRAAIEAAEKQEPVAWMGEYNINDIRDHYTVVMRHKTDFSSMPDRVRPLYTHPQPAIPEGWQAVVSEFIAAWDGSADPKAVGSTCRFIRAESALRDLVAAPKPVVPAWQPIETAPRDGVVILLGLPAVGTLKDASERRVYEGRWNEVQNAFTSVNGFILLAIATHWMPLPAAPKPENNHD